MGKIILKMLCHLVWKFILWFSRNLLEISLLPPFIPTLLYEKALWQLREPLWQLHWNDFHGKFCKGTHMLFPIFLSFSFTLGKGRRETSTAWWNLKLWLVLGNNVNFARLSSLVRSSAFWRECWGLVSNLQRAVTSEDLVSIFLAFSISCLRGSLGA